MPQPGETYGKKSRDGALSDTSLAAAYCDDMLETPSCGDRHGTRCRIHCAGALTGAPAAFFIAQLRHLFLVKGDLLQRTFLVLFEGLFAGLSAGFEGADIGSLQCHCSIGSEPRGDKGRNTP